MLPLTVARCQEPPAYSVERENIAGVTTSTGILIQMCIKPQKGDNKPLPDFHLLTTDQQYLPIFIPENTRQECIKVLIFCQEEKLEIIVSGSMIRYTNNFGTIGGLMLEKLEISVR